MKNSQADKASGSKGNAFTRTLGQALDVLEPLIQLLIRFCGWSSILLVAAIFFFIFLEAGEMVWKLNWKQFFFSYLSTTPFISTVNLLAGKEIVTESFISGKRDIKALANPCASG